MNVLHKVTRQNLKKNKVRTVVTIIGVILSVAMITAVTTMVSTLQAYMITSVVTTEGDWYFKLESTDPQLEQTLRQDDRLERIGSMQSLGYAVLEGGRNEYKPYWYVTAWDEEMFQSVPVTLTSGRLPANGQEIAIPSHMAANGGVFYEVGDTVTLDLGYRVFGDEYLWQAHGYWGEDEPTDGADDALAAQAEELMPVTSRTFTVVGIYERLDYDVEEYAAPGYTAITRPDASDKVLATGLYVRTVDPGEVQSVYAELTDTWQDELYFDTAHYDLLHVMGVLDNETIMKVAVPMAVILLIIIMVGAVTLIYNAFSISAGERSKQFGLLSSVGATRRQLRGSVLYEAAVIGGIGIPLGILSGIGGIGVTLWCLRDWISSLMLMGSGIPMELSVSWASVIAAALLGMLTILISAWIPAKRASRVTAIEAIRQSQDIQVKAKQVKTSPLTRKLFGFEGEMALKNLKRSRRRYRSTVLSLAVSVVLFISASAFTLYAFNSSERMVDPPHYDVEYGYRTIGYTDVADQPDEAEKQQLFAQLLAPDSVSGGTTVEIFAFGTAVPKEAAAAEFYNEQQEWQSAEGVEPGLFLTADGAATTGVVLTVVDEASFDAYARSVGASPADYKGETLSAIALRAYYAWDMESERREMQDWLKTPTTLDLQIIDRETGRNYTDGQPELPVRVLATTDTLPMWIKNYSSCDQPYLILPDTQLPLLRDWLYRQCAGQETVSFTSSTRMVFTAEESAKATAAIAAILTEQQLSTDSVDDLHEDDAYEQRLMAILKVFTYGFITLISLITVANVFNTISTNIHLRRREFAMLQSVGLSPKGFRRMMHFECVFYGLKALLYGLPVSFLVMYAMYRSILTGVEIRFLVPWSSVGISVGCVFLVVFITMLYATHKIRRENIIDGLKTDMT